MLKIEETFLCGKENNPATCEDGIFISEYIVAVIDGVTAKGHRLWDGKSSGCFAKNCLIEYLEKNDVKNLQSAELFSTLDEVLATKVKEIGEPIAVEDFPRASIIVYNDIFHEIWSYGDCQCRINDIIYSHVKKIDQINEEIRAKKLEECIANGYSIEDLLKNDVGRIAIQENLMKQFSYENKLEPYGYPVLNGKGIEPQFITKYKVKPNDTVILASDGYPKLGKNLEESENILEDILKRDPLCFRKYRCTKGVKPGNVSFDDRVFCKINV